VLGGRVVNFTSVLVLSARCVRLAEGLHVTHSRSESVAPQIDILI